MKTAWRSEAALVRRLCRSTASLYLGINLTEEQYSTYGQRLPRVVAGGSSEQQYTSERQKKQIPGDSQSVRSTATFLAGFCCVRHRMGTRFGTASILDSKQHVKVLMDFLVCHLGGTGVFRLIQTLMYGTVIVIA